MPFAEAAGDAIKRNTDFKETDETNQADQTFDGLWPSDEAGEYSRSDESNQEPSPENKSEKQKKTSIRVESSEPSAGSRDHFWKHKTLSLRGKLACKYCDTFFSTKQEKWAHKCKYLDCDPKNFICRICKKELSKRTFSNHLHETLSCQFCGKKFVNPRSMKTHLRNQHKGKKIVKPDLTEDLLRKKEELEEAYKAQLIKQKPQKLKYECGGFDSILFVS